MYTLPEGITVQRLEGNRDLTECRNIRRTVFIDEQKVTEGEEWDGLDSFFTHFLLKEKGKVVGTARVKINAMNEAKLGRLALLQEARGKGLGKVFMEWLLDDIKKVDKNLKIVKISAQTSVLPFYEKLGFVKTGNEYMEANIPHYAMTWTP
jgi:ElaA protein